MASCRRACRWRAEPHQSGARDAPLLALAASADDDCGGTLLRVPGLPRQAAMHASSTPHPQIVPRGMVIRIVGLGCAAQTRSLAFAFPFNAVIAQQVLIHPPGCARDQSQRSAFKCAETMRFRPDYSRLSRRAHDRSSKFIHPGAPKPKPFVGWFLMGGWKARGRLVEGAVLDG